MINNIAEQKIEEYLVNIKENLSLNNFSVAKQLLDEAIKKFPSDYQLYMLYVRLTTENYTKVFDTSHLEYLEKAVALASPLEQAEIETEYSVFVKKKQETINKENEVNEESKKRNITILIIGVLVGLILAFVYLLCEISKLT